MLLLGVWAIPLSASTSTINQSTLVSSFNETSHSVSWDAEDHKVTFTLVGTNKAIYSTLGNLYMASGPVGLVPQNTGATFTLSWSVDADYNLAVSKVTINVNKASGIGSYITVGDGSRTGDVHWMITANLSSGSKVYTTFESVPIVFEKAGTWSTVAVNYITITYTLIPKFIFKGNGSGSESDHLKWEQADNWLPNALPTINDSVFIRHDAVITGNATAKSVTIEGTNKVTVAPTGTLKVGDGGVKNATTENFKLQAATAGTNQGQSGVLLIDPSCTTMPSATAEMYSKAYFDMTADDRNNVGSYQYVGSPMVAGTAAKTIFPNSWVYSWFEDSGEWKNKRKTLTLEPFVGYCTSQYMDPAGILIEHKGQLASNGDQVLNLSYTPTSAEPGINVLANSYTAPIDITKFVDTDFSTGVDATIYLFNTGSKNDVTALTEFDGNAAGQFIAIPIHLAGTVKDGFLLPAVIPAMQGFYVKANSAGSTLTLNYERLVWNATHSNTPLRAKRAEEQQKGSLCVMVEADGWRDQVYLLEAEEYDAAFENGYDAHKLMQGNLNIFTLEGEEALAVDATNHIAGTKIGVRTGEETAYTLTFGALSGETEWSLYDAQAQETIAIEEGMQYTFFAEPNSEIRDRFYITERNDAPAITTDLEKVGDGTESRKFIKDGRLFVIKNGLIYNVLGVVVSR
ncbi:MAG: hypothetical protein IJR42_00340 [Paludibacteraceae bacterium]|nr:hypothetical protein [Paludibacteraceae bacterium]